MRFRQAIGKTWRLFPNDCDPRLSSSFGLCIAQVSQMPNLTGDVSRRSQRKETNVLDWESVLNSFGAPFFLKIR